MPVKSGQARSITDPSEQEGVTVAYICRLLPPKFCAPLSHRLMQDRPAEIREPE